ncbi:MAG: type III pantothenate kinase [Thermodesulfovibrio sp.]|nr:type III pantothenate kinase [Thermodesulfovibrio sp.]
MLLAVKIGNSNISIVIFNNPKKENFLVLFEKEIKNLNWDELNKVVYQYDGINCIVCSVVPELTRIFIKNYQSIFKNFLIINSKIDTGLSIKVKNSEKFGADRLTCSLAAYEKYRENLAIIDAGTATTITIVTNKGEVLGGSIMPGLQTMNYSLHEKTALLPIIEINKSVSALGIDTKSAIRSGIVLGTVYAIEGIIKEIEKSIKLKLTPILTGGNASFLSQYLNFFHYLEPHLVIEGMRLIYLKNIKN